MRHRHPRRAKAWPARRSSAGPCRATRTEGRRTPSATPSGERRTSSDRPGYDSCTPIASCTTCRDLRSASPASSERPSTWSSSSLPRRARPGAQLRRTTSASAALDPHRHDHCRVARRDAGGLSGRLENARRKLVAKLDVHLRAVDHRQDVHEVARVEPDLEGSPGIGDGNLLLRVAEIRILARHLERVLPELELDGVRGPIAGEDAHAAEGIEEPRTVDGERPIRLLGDDLHVVREDPVDEPHHHLDVAPLEDSGRLGEAELAGAFVILLQEPLQLEEAFAWDDAPLLEIEVPGGGALDEREPVPIRRHHPDVALRGLEVDAVQVVAGLVRRDGKLGLLDHLEKLTRIDGDERYLLGPRERRAVLGGAAAGGSIPGGR